MKTSSALRASHVNRGTSVSRSDLAVPPTRGPVFRHPKLRTELESTDTTAMGGLSLAATLVTKLGIPKLINAGLSLLESHRPFHESDHVLTHVYNLFVGGSAIEDIADLQHSEPVRRMLGTDRIPDPSTAGDFLRRFGEEDIESLDGVIDQVHQNAWKQRWGRRKQKLGIIDVDSHVHHVYGHQKEGADFTYKGGFGYHPLVISIAGTQECLRLVNRSGNTASADGTAEHLKELVPMLKSRFKRILVRGDSAFARQDIFDTCDANGMYFAMVSSTQKNFQGLADAIKERHWRPFRAKEDQPSGKRKKRKRGKNLRSKRARERGKRDLKLEKQWISEINYQPARSARTYRLIVRRQRIEESNQGELFELWRYRYVLTNLPRSESTESVIRQTYRRCDQENVIEQLQSGVAAMRMPTGSLLANHAFLLCARLAQNFKAWLAMLALGDETMRWEWKRFRKAFVYVAAKVTTSGRSWIVRLASSHRFAEDIQRGIIRLQT